MIPDGVTSIGDWVFHGCSGLTSVMIPNSVVSIEDRAFDGCSGLMSISVGSGNANYKSVNGLLLSKDGKTLIAGVNGNVVIPDGVTSIGDWAFFCCSGLTSVTIPNSVRSIGDHAFDGCSGLTSVTIPNGVWSVGWGVFCDCSSLTSVTIGNGVSSIGFDMFCDCSNLTSVVIGNGVGSIERAAFSGCSGLSKVTIPSGVTSIEYGAFGRCSGLTSVTIPASVTDIENGAFVSCSSLKSISVDIGNTNYKSENGLLLSKDGKTLIAGVNGNVVIPDSVTSIGEHAFSGYSGLTNVTIPNNVTSIGDYAFEDCGGLTNVTIPDSVTDIGHGTFFDCSSLESIFVDIGNSNYKSDNGLLLSKDGKTLVAGVNGNVVIPDSVKNIGEFAFRGCSGLTSVVIPSSVTYIYREAFSRCNALSRIQFNGNAPRIIGFEYVFGYDNVYGSYEGDTFYGLESECTVYVKLGSAGWGVSIPGMWNGVKIQYQEKALTAKPRIYCDAAYTVVPGKACNIPITVVSSIKNTTVSVKGLPSGLKYSGGKISGKAKKPGTSKVTITAKNSKGTVTKKITIKVRNPGFRVAVAPLTINGKTSDDYDDITSSGQTITVRVGFRQSFTLTATPGIADVASSSASVKLSGLPSGLSYKNGKISGVVRKAGTKTVTVKCTNKWGWSKTFTIKIKALALPSAVVGTFNGYTGIYSDEIDVDNINVYTNFACAYYSEKVALTATSGGKLSAKIGSISVSGSYWAFDEETGHYTAVLTGTRKTGSPFYSTLTDCLTVDIDPMAAWNRFQLIGTFVTGSSNSMGLNYGTVVAQRNPFGKNSKGKYVNAAAGKIVSKIVKYGTMKTACYINGGAGVYDLAGPTCGMYPKGYKFPLSFKVNAAGKVTVSGKIGSLTVSGSTTLRVSPTTWDSSSYGWDLNVIGYDEYGDEIYEAKAKEMCFQADFLLKSASKPICIHIEFSPTSKTCRHGWATVGDHLWNEYYDDDDDEWGDEDDANACEKVQLWKDGPYWATVNIGAENPEDYGYYFWWGDTVGYKRENDTWVASDGSSLGFSFESGNIPTYGKTISTLQNEGWVTVDNVLAPKHDAAYMQWGGNWRMPTDQELDDLNNKCDWTWTTINGVNGYVVHGRGDYTSASIFLPCAGYGNGTSLRYAGSYGNYWSSVPNSDIDHSWSLFFSSIRHRTNYYYRDDGQSIRPVQGFAE